jgi:hypothetical protein
MTPQLSWKEAITAVLQDAVEPLSAAEIVDEIKHRELRTDFGATPADTVGAQISSSIKKDGTGSPFVRLMPGRFALRSPGQSADPFPVAHEEEKDPEGVTSKTYGVINALGMFWERSKVDWKNQPRVLGRQVNGTTDVDFCAQRGVYLLHDAQGIVYVGRTTERNLGKRLFEHLADRLGGRWDRFSWFGVYPVNEDGTLRADADFSHLSIDVVIATMEAILIEAIEPRQNRKRGDTNFEDIEYLQREDPKIKQKRDMEIVQGLIAGSKSS